MIWITLVLAMVVRLVNLNQSLWLDEATQAVLSSKSLSYIWFERGGDFHPPLSYILTHFWLMVGTSEIWLRLLPVFFGVATVFVIYKISQKLFSEKIALISSLLLATAPYHIYYSQEIRMYSMTTFFASLSMYFFVTSKPVGYVLSTAALLYTHYMGIFLVLSQAIYFLINNKKEFLNYSKLLLGIFLIYLLWIPQLYQQLISGVKADQYLPGWGSLLSLEPLKALPLTFIKFGIGRIDFENIYVYKAVAVAVLGFYGLLALKALSKETKLIWLWLLVPIIFSWLISFFVPINQPFRLLLTLPAFYLLLSLGICYLGKWQKIALGIVIIISIWGLSLYYFNPKFWREDWRGAVGFINKNIGDDTDILFVWPEPFPPYIWYHGKNGVGLIQKFPASSIEIKTNLSKLSNSKQVYLFEYLQDLSDPQRITQQELIKSGYQLKETKDFRGVGFVYLWVI